MPKAASGAKKKTAEESPSKKTATRAPKKESVREYPPEVDDGARAEADAKIRNALAEGR